MFVSVLMFQIPLSLFSFKPQENVCFTDSQKIYIHIFKVNNELNSVKFNDQSSSYILNSNIGLNKLSSPKYFLPFCATLLVFILPQWGLFCPHLSVYIPLLLY